jgi:hypothetical protein
MDAPPGRNGHRFSRFFRRCYTETQRMVLTLRDRGMSIVESVRFRATRPRALEDPGRRGCDND